MFFQIIETSSAGNCGFLEYDGVNVLIDVGLGVRKIESYLKTRSLGLDDIDAIFVTHEHIDHRKSLKYFANKRTRIFANRLTAESIVSLDPETKGLLWNYFENGNEFDFNGIGVCAFSVPHDTSDSVGYKFKLGERNLVWMTDFGKATYLVKEMARLANILVLESNYCEVMLDNSNRSFSLKSRIKNSHGHLSNTDAINIIQELSDDTIEHIFLAHISRDCNSVERISELLEDVSIKEKIEIVAPLTQSGCLVV